MSPGWLRRLTVGALALLLCGACGDTRDEGAATLRVALPAFPRSLVNPIGSTSLPALYTFAAIFDALTYLDGNGTLQPALAVSWQRQGPNVWRFKLRPGTRFSNGEPLNAAAVAQTVEYVKSPEAAGFTVAATLASIASARVIDELTLDIATSHPNLFLPRELSDLRIVAPAAWAIRDGRRVVAEPIGTGPYAVRSWDAGSIELTAFDESWRPPSVPRLELRALPDPASRVQALLSGGVDVALTLVPEDREQLVAAGHRMDAVPHSSVLGLSFVTTRFEPLQDVRVRRALNYAVDKQQLARLFMGDAVEPASQFVVPTAFGHDPSLRPYPFDPDRARALLREAGYGDGF